MMKLLITGASGMVGSEIIKQATGHDVIPLSHRDMDITDKEHVDKIIAMHMPDIIIHLAAKTDVDWCENNADECYMINVAGTKNIAEAADKYGAIIVYPSTFYVYSGEKKDAYDDRIDIPNLNSVVGVYSRSKLLGEEIVNKINNHFIIRFGALFGGGDKDNKFVRKILEISKIQNELKMVSDRIVQPSYVKDTVRNMLELIKTKKYGTYNMVGHGNATYYEYAKAILEFAGAKNVMVMPIKSGDFKEAAPRPKNLSAVNGKLGDMGLDLMRDWKVSLKDYIENELGYK